MKILGMMPVRNERWVLPHSLACLSAFCDVVLVSDQRSDDDSREICRRFPKVVVLESTEIGVCEQARWQLLDAARDYDGFNLWWWNDADELVSPRLARAALQRDFPPGTALECLFYHLWNDAGHYRDDGSPYYGPHWKPMAIVDDRRTNYDRSSALPLHQPRVAVEEGRALVRLPELPVFHLQWLVANHNQMKQAWYRCRELLNGDRAVDINAKYSITFPAPRARTSGVPPAWVEDITFPPSSADDGPCWQERDIDQWFAQYGPAFFERLEIWHIPALRREFFRRVGRRPKPDRSYRPSWPTRARWLAGRVARAGGRRLGLTNG